MDFDDITPAPGVLLIAPPLMADPNFRRTVVLLCEHNDEGSFGLILNRPLALHLGEVMTGMEAYADPLLLGGPVQPDTLHFLHRYGTRVPEAIDVAAGVSWGGDFDQIRSLVLTGETSAHDLRFFLGYAGWSPDQLAHEIDLDGWLLAYADADVVFSEAPDRLWNTVLRRMGGEYALLANFPEDPRLN